MFVLKTSRASRPILVRFLQVVDDMKGFESVVYLQPWDDNVTFENEKSRKRVLMMMVRMCLFTNLEDC